MKTKSVIFLLFAVIFTLSACSSVEQNYPITVTQDDGTIITIEQDGSMTIEQADGVIITRDTNGTITRTQEEQELIIEKDGRFTGTNVVNYPSGTLDDVTEFVTPGTVDGSKKTDPTRIMSADEAMKITEGKIVHLQEYDYVDSFYGLFNACLTPSGKLIYIPEWEFSKLSDQTDFDITWGHNGGVELNIRTDYPATAENTVAVSAVLSDETAVKYDLYLTYDFYDEDHQDFICYPRVSSGNLVFDMGLTLDNADYSDHDVTYTVSGGENINKNDPLILTGKVGQTVYIEDQSRTYPFNDKLKWQISAEVKDSDGNVVYTEEFTVYESYISEENTFYIAKGERVVK